MPVLTEKRGAGGCASGRPLEQLRGIGRKCAFYNGFAGSVPTKFRFRCAACNQAAILVRYVVFFGVGAVPLNESRTKHHGEANT